MRSSGRKCIDRIWRAVSGAVTITELLVVMIVSLILLTAVFSGQTFINKISQRFFAGTTMETEARLILQTVENDLVETERFGRLDESSWELYHWPGDKTVYRFADSTLWRDSQAIIGSEVCVLQFDMDLDSSSSNGITRVHVFLQVNHKGRTLDFQATHPLQKRAPGS